MSVRLGMSLFKRQVIKVVKSYSGNVEIVISNVTIKTTSNKGCFRNITFTFAFCQPFMVSSHRLYRYVFRLHNKEPVDDIRTLPDSRLIRPIKGDNIVSTLIVLAPLNIWQAYTISSVGWRRVNFSRKRRGRAGEIHGIGRKEHIPMHNRCKDNRMHVVHV